MIYGVVLERPAGSVPQRAASLERPAEVGSSLLYKEDLRGGHKLQDNQEKFATSYLGTLPLRYNPHKHINGGDLSIPLHKKR